MASNMKRLALLAALLLSLNLNAFEFTGKVVGVTDGDTITVLAEGNKQHRVRLQHIDCPERHQPFWAKAKQSLSANFGKSHRQDRHHQVGRDGPLQAHPR